MAGGVALAIRFDQAPHIRALRELGKRGPVAIARGLNRTIATVRTTQARAVAKDMGIPVAAAREAMRIEKASAAKPVARIVVSGRRLPLIDFRASGPHPTRGRGRGVSAVVQGQRKRYPSAFIATTASQADGSGGAHRGVFIRKRDTTRTGRGGWSKNLPITELHGVSIAVAFGRLAPVGEAERVALLEKNVAHEIEFELSRLRA